MAWLGAGQGVIAVVKHRPTLPHREVAQQHAAARRECPGDVGVDCPGVGKALGHHGGRQRKPLAAGLIPSELNQHAKLAHARR